MKGGKRGRRRYKKACWNTLSRSLTHNLSLSPFLSHAQMLSEAGYKDLVSVAGGFDSWSGSGLPVAK
jgi:hypothetical protein